MKTTMRTVLRRLSLGIFLVSVLSTARSQFSIIAYPPPADFTFEDLWHFTITGPVGSNYTEFYVALRVYNDGGGLLVKSNSSVFQVNGGVMYLNKSSLSTISPLNTMYYQYLLQQLISNGDFFPAGAYNVVLNLMGRPTDGEFSELSESAYSVQVQVFMPPILIYPEDMDTVDSPFPLLSWLPAYQAATGQQIKYHLYMTEVFSGQTAQQSITANPIHFEQFEVPITAMVYPAGANAIVQDHTYAWQVAATVNGSPIAYSQIWQFTYAVPAPVISEPASFSQYYTFFEEIGSAVVPVRESSIRVRVEENYHSGMLFLAFRIYNDKNELVASSDNLNIEIFEGISFAEIPLCGPNVSLTYDKLYLVEIENIKHKKHYMRIRNLFNTNNCD